MRPKKRILIVDHDEYRRSLSRFRLSTNGYAVFAADTAPNARAVFETCAPDLVIVSSAVRDRDWLLKILHEQNPFVPQIVLAPWNGECNAIADAVLRNPTPFELLERIKVITARKHGPHPAKPVVSETRAAMEAAREIA